MLHRYDNNNSPFFPLLLVGIHVRVSLRYCGQWGHSSNAALGCLRGLGAPPRLPESTATHLVICVRKTSETWTQSSVTTSCSSNRRKKRKPDVTHACADCYCSCGLYCSRTAHSLVVKAMQMGRWKLQAGALACAPECFEAGNMSHC